LLGEDGTPKLQKKKGRTTHYWLSRSMYREDSTI
jgi:hypothetical protein